MKTFPHFVKGIDPVANAFAGTVYTDVFSMRNYKTALIQMYIGVGATGTSTITVEGCSTVGAAATTAVPFLYQQILTGDTASALTQATTAGFTTTAGSSKFVNVWVDASDIGATGYEFVRGKFVEVAASACLGGVTVMLLDPRFDEDIQPTAIV